MGPQHPLPRFTTSPITYLPRWKNFARDHFDAEWSPVNFNESLPQPIIGNDVWIGQDVLLKTGIRVGDGSAIASRAVVTRDVPPYSIVGGVPAKIIRPRFNEKLVDRLLRVKWWEFNFVDLPRRNWEDIDAFLGELETQRRQAKSSDGPLQFMILAPSF